MKPLPRLPKDGLPPARELERLQQVRRLRTDAALAALHARRAEQDRADAALRASAARVAQCETARAALVRRAAVADPADLARYSACTVALREHHDDRIERARDALIEDRQTRADALARLGEARAAWVRAQARGERVDAMTQARRRAMAQHIELQTESEHEDTFRGRPAEP